MSQPLVSVICCTFNAGPFLEEAITSILNQTYKNIELIVVDDGSTDESLECVSRISDKRLKVLRQQNSGKSVALNTALAASQGEFYAIQDGDDSSYPRRIELQVKRLLEKRDLGGVFCGHDLILGNRRWAPRSREKTSDECRVDIERFRMPAHDPTVMYRMSYVRGIEYDPELRVGQGFDHILRVGEVFPLAVLGECLYSYRVNPESVTRRIPHRRLEAIERVRRKACERRGLDFSKVFEDARTTQISYNGLATDFIESIVDLCAQKRRFEAIRNGLYCVFLAPASSQHYKGLLYALLPVAIRRRIRPSERKA